MGEQADLRQRIFDAVCHMIEDRTDYKISDFDGLKEEIYGSIKGTEDEIKELEKEFTKKIKKLIKEKLKMLAENIYNNYLKEIIDKHGIPKENLSININKEKLNYKNTEVLINDLKSLEDKNLICIKDFDYVVQTTDSYYKDGSKKDNILITIKKEFYNYISQVLNINFE